MRNSILITILAIWLFNCDSSNSNECGENPGCVPPTSQFFQFNFELINGSNEVIELTDSDLEEIHFETQGLQENLTLIQNNQLSTLLTGLNQGYEPESSLYNLKTPYGEGQEIKIIVSSNWQDDCQWCKDYLISHVIQNEQDTVFAGELNGDLISLKLK